MTFRTRRLRMARGRVRGSAGAAIALLALLVASLAGTVPGGSLLGAAMDIPTIPGILPGTPTSGPPAGQCTWTPLGPSEIRNVYTQPAETNDPNRRSAFAGVDRTRPCHLFRSYAARTDRSDSSGASFVTAFTPATSSPSLGPVISYGAGTLWVYDRAGSGIFRTSDYGQSWSETDQGVAGVGSGVQVAGITAMALGFNSAGQHLYAITSNGAQTTLYATTNGGDLWSPTTAPSPTLTSIAIDPTDANHVWVGSSTPAAIFESTDGGSTWGVRSAPGGGAPAALVVTHPAAPILFARTGAPGNEVWWRSPDSGVTWRQMPGTGSAALAIDPGRPSQVVMAQAHPEGILLSSSTDGFATITGALSFGPRSAGDLQLLTDDNGDYFLQATTGGSDAMYAFRIGAIPSIATPPPPPPQGSPRCPLQAQSPPLNNTVPPGKQTQQEWWYTSGSLTFDGQYLDYTYAPAPPDSLKSPSPQENQPHGIDLPGKIFRIDPGSPGCPSAPTILVDKAGTGGKDQRFYYLAYDPRFVTDSGEVGAILAKGEAGALTGDPPDVAPIWAITPSSGHAELVARVRCFNATDHPNCESDGGFVTATLFTYDFFSDRLWVNIPDATDSQARPMLAALPRTRGALLTGDPGCLSTLREDDTRDRQVSTWTVGGPGVVYFVPEDDGLPQQTATQVNSTTCQEGYSFPHTTYQEAPAENDQLACDPLTLGTRSVLWIRDQAANAVERYEIPDGVCPFPDRMSLDQPVTASEGQTVPVCAHLFAASAAEQALAGETITFSVASKPVGNGITNGNGLACVNVSAPQTPGALALVASFAGTRAYLPMTANGTMTVVGTRQTAAPPPPPPGPQARAAAPPPPAPVPVPGPQVQAQSQMQAQLQAQPGAQVQPGVAAQEETQAEVQVARIDGERGDRQRLNASRLARRDDTIAALYVQGLGLTLLAAALFLADRRFRQARIAPARSDQR